MSSEQKHGKKKVLMIDDDREFSGLVKTALEFQPGFEVRVENDSRIALEVARKFVPDIVILDVVMPDVDGGEVHARFQADPVLKKIPIIFLSSIVQQKEIDANNGLIGGHPYLAKPVSASVLIKAISKHLGS